MRQAAIARAAVAALVTCGLLALLAPAASAHAFLVSQEPGPGDVLAGPPASVRMVYTERLEPAYSYAYVRDATGARVDLDGGTVPPGEPNVLVVALPRLPNGTYLVEWSTLSVDTHSAAGNYSFGIGQAAATTQGTGAGEAHAHGPLGRIMFLSGLLSVPGILLVTHLLRLDARTRREMHAYAAAMAVLATVGACFVYLDAAEPLQDFAGYFVATGSGKLVVATIAALATTAGILVRTVSKPTPWHIPAAVALLATAVACTAATSHGAARTSGALLGATADAVHLAAACVWVGGVVGLALWLPNRPAQEAAVAVARFSPWAMGAVAVLVAAGVAGASMHLRHPRDLWSTFYGGLLLGKILLAALLVGLGWLNRRRIGPGLAAGVTPVKTLRRTLAVEASLMFLVVILTVVLTATPPTTQVG